ncbi:MAG: hypothetical protein C4320_06025 [Armatimonadota bacterium]
MSPGETKTQDELKITYVRPTMAGEPGQPGTKFGAILNVEYRGRVTAAHPELEITPDGLRPTLVAAGTDFKIAMTTVSPADRSISLQALLSPPVYPVELFEKPLTSLVWLGTLIFTIGAGMAAVSRRVRISRPAPVAIPIERGGAGATLPASQS